MDLSILTLILSICTLAIVVYIFLKLRDQKTIESGKSENLENKIDSVSKDLNEIENQLASVTTPINELNRFLGGNVTTGRLGEWNLESIVKEILPDGSYNFQAQINKETQDRVDCAVKTADGLTIPIDSKFYAGQYKQYQEANRDNERGNVLRDLRTAILRDADDIASKYIRQNTTSNYAVLYIASEKLIDLVDDIENLRQDCLAEKKVLIQGPNTLAAFLDTIRIGHHYLQLNETAEKVAEVVRRIKTQFDSFDKSTEAVTKRLEASIKEVSSLQTRINVLGRIKVLLISKTINFNNMKFIYLLLLSLNAAFLISYTPLENIRVVDGDTIRAEAKGREIKIRLVEIDAPEINQPFGAQSKNFLNRLLNEKDVTLISQGEDRYGRVLGEIYANGESANALMIKSGFAWVYDRYVKDSSLYKYQDQAKAENLGLWRAEDPIAPWVWRKQK